MSFNKKVFTAWLLIVLVIGLYSCAPSPLKGLEKQTPSIDVLQSIIHFDNNGQANYRCHVEAFDQLISGMMIFKKTELNTRVLMMTDFGLKVLDISFTANGQYKINYIMKHFDYQFVRESFALNILMLLDQQISINTYFYQKFDSSLFYHQKMLFFQKDGITQKVKRYRGKKKLIAIVKMQKSANIDIQQFQPPISMTLSPIIHVKK